MDRVLEVKNIEKYYGNKSNITKAIDNISFSAYKGEFVGIMGPSGSGKTTLLKCISTMDKVSTGDIIINGKDITKFKEKEREKFKSQELGFIFQEYNLLDTLTAHENIALSLTIQGRNYKEIDSLVSNAAKILGIENIIDKYPYEMSGGQKQRVACARAIVSDPSLILADEPTGALDSKSANSLLEMFKNLNEEMKTTIIMVTHDAFTASYADRILFIKDGRIFNEIVKGNSSRKEFFNRIIEVVTLLGGDVELF